MQQIIQYYDDIATSYDADRFGNSYGRFIDTQEKRILDHLLTGCEEPILDLACGSGRLLKYATIGVDASAEMLKLAKAKYPEKQLLQAEANAMPLDPASVDTVISFHFFMHLDRPDIENILTEVHRVLKNGGRFIFDIPSGKRRKLLGYSTNSWHGAYSANLEEISEMSHEIFTIKRSYGILMLPIHRLPRGVRKFFSWFDYYLANSFLKAYSSYLIIELQKK
jgi:ubiquinone/menaquinone biosynthesis C-methylase UbiE